MALKDRHLYGAGAAACAVCCAAPILGVLGIAGAAATFATFVFAGAVFALVVGLATLGAVLVRRRQAQSEPCATDGGSEPVTINLSPTRPADAP
jgi:hypothetical protein